MGPDTDLAIGHVSDIFAKGKIISFITNLIEKRVTKIFLHSRLGKSRLEEEPTGSG